MKGFRWLLALLLVWNGLAFGAQGDVEIHQEPIECWPIDQFLLIQSSFVPPEEIQTAKFYFRSTAHPDYYYIELTLGQSGGNAIAPKAQPDTVEVTFYTELVTLSFSAFRTEERTVPVASGAECKRRDPETAYYNGQNPDIAVGATRAGATPMPPGFQANGISRFMNVIGTQGATAGGGISGKTVGIIGGAGAGAALLLLGGGSDATTTGPVGGITTSSPLSSSTTTAIGGVTSTTTTAGGGGTSTSSTTTTIGGGSTTTIFGSTTTVVGGSTTTVIGGSTTTVVGSSTTTSAGTSSTTTVIGSSTTTSVVGSSTTTSVGTSTTTSASSTTTSVGTSTTTKPSTTTSVGSSTTTSAPSTTTSASSSTTTSTPSSTTSSSSTTTRPSTTTAGAAQLTISKGDSPDPVRVGTTLTYTIAIRNVGTANATGVTMEDTLPGSVALTFINNPNCRDFGGGDVRCFSLSIPAGQTLTILIRVTPLAVGTITNRAAITVGPNFPSASQSTTVTLTQRTGDRPEPVVVKTFLDIEPYNGRSRGRVVFNDSDALEIANTSPVVHHVQSRPGENRVEATMLAGEARRRGFWRFDFGGAPRFVPGSLQVDAGQVYAQDGRTITFAVGDGSALRFRYQVENDNP